MQKYKLERLLDDPNIDWDDIRTANFTSANYCVRQINSNGSYNDDCIMLNEPIPSFFLDADEISLKRHLIKKFRDIYLESWLSRWNYVMFIPYAPPSFEYYNNGDCMIIEICFYHDLGTYYKISASNKVSNKQKSNLASLYKSHFMSEPNYVRSYPDKEFDPIENVD